MNKRFLILLILISCISMLNGQVKLSGIVKDVSGNTIPGVSVVQKGTTVGTTTDIDGKYQIQVSSSAVLQFSFVGMKAVEVQVNGRNYMDVQLESETIGLDEVVVTSLGIQRNKKTLTYSSQQLDSEEIMKARGINFMENLSGKTAGLEIEKSASGAGGSTRVILRGFKSLAGSSEPLYVIDGVPVMNLKRGQPGMWGGADNGDGLSQLNPDDIETINVLKGLNASVLYGSQGANGVVLVTTKRGIAGKTEVTINSTTSFESVMLYPEMQFDYGAIDGAKESWSTIKGNTKYTEDMMRDFFNTGINLVNGVTARGGNNKTTAYFSYNNTTAKGIIPNNKYGKNNVSFKQTTRIFEDKLELSSNVILASELIENRNVAGYYLNPLTGLYNFPRERDWMDYRSNYKVFNETRNMFLQNVYVADHHLSNPYWIVNMEPKEEKIQRMIANTAADYNITNHWKLLVRGTYEYVDYSLTQKDYAGSNVTNISQNGRYIFSENTITKAYADALLKYENDFGKLNVTGFVGGSYTKGKWSGKNADNGTNNLLYPNVFSTQNYPNNVVINEYGGKNILQSLYANVSLGYNDMFYIDISGRNDWSSTLIGTDDGTSYFYPSAGGVVMLSNVFSLPKIISFLKIRGSIAQAAKEVPWNAIRSDNSISGAFGGITRSTRQPWTDLKPELISSNELGTEIKLLKGRVGLDFTFYNNKSTNQFLTVDLPPAERGQYQTKNINVGEIVNKGVEMTLDLIPVQKKSVNWKTAFNFHNNNNKIIELDPDNPNRTYDLGSSEGYITFLRTGGSFGDLYGYKFRRNESGQIMLEENTGRPLKTAVQFDPNDWTVGYLGNLQPDWTLGWNNNIQVERFNIGLLISGKFGGKVVSQTESMLDGWGVSKRTGNARDVGYVEINGIKGTTPVAQINPFDYYAEGAGIGGRNGIIEPYVYERTNIRVNQLSVAYDLKVQKWFNSVTLSLVGQNLLILYKKAPYDPELVMNTSNYFQSLDNFNVPATRTYGFNIKLKF